MQELQQKIERHYNIWAEKYSENSRVSQERARELLHLLHRHVWLLPGYGWADIGCRSGETLAEAVEREMLRPTGQWGFDPSERMISLARDNYPRLARWIVAEPTSLPLEDEQAHGALVNGGWQWLFRAEKDGPKKALRETRRILRGNSLVAIAHPGRGSDAALQQAVAQTTRENPAWAEGAMPEDPLGASSLQELLYLAQEAGFQAVYGQERYEPVMYSNLSLYLEEIEYTSQAAWLLHFDERHWEEAWQEVGERMSEETEDGFMRSVFSVYLLLRTI